MNKSLTPIYKIAEDFTENTSLPIFLTGKAGTGKTTFLKNLKENTHKQIAVVAPTGVAAINASGTTIHSFFQLPLSPFVPTEAGRRDLIQKMKVNKNRRNVLQQLEILVIDEISMVRADLLDAIDTVLRHYRFRRNEPFGGVQIIYIGDLYQLPPVTHAEEWNTIAKYYVSPYFFDSYVVREQPPVYIELDKIFRQSDTDFLALLNEVRNNNLSNKGFELLKSRYNPLFKLSENPDYIFLTTHNATASRINEQEMRKIKATAYTYDATVKGDFPEKATPNEVTLTLKVGAKVMFIANDVNHRYYNGRIGRVSRLDKTHIFVQCEDSSEEIPVSPETWRNIRYEVDTTNGLIIEKELGTFTQFPLRLAWAITIHKSQGLTFDKTAIDAVSAFSSGQVYVALSRCRSLEGIVLTSPIQQTSLRVDSSVQQYVQNKLPVERLEQLLTAAKGEYHLALLQKSFDLPFACGQMSDLLKLVKSHSGVFNQEGIAHAWALQKELLDLQDVSLRFREQIAQIYADSQLLIQRLAAAKDYYLNHLADCIQRCSNSPASIFDYDIAKEYQEKLQTLFEELSFKKHLIAGICDHPTSIETYYQLKEDFVIPTFTFKASSIFDDEDEKVATILGNSHAKRQTRGKASQKEKKKKPEIPPSALVSIEMYQSGKKIDEIAAERQLVPGTIGTHLSYGIAHGMIPLSDFVPDELAQQIQEQAAAGCKVSEIFSNFEGNVDYLIIRMALTKVKNKQ